MRWSLLVLLIFLLIPFGNCKVLLIYNQHSGLKSAYYGAKELLDLYSIDYLSLSMPSNSKILKSFDVVILNDCSVLSKSEREAIREYVRSGGRVICSGDVADYDENDNFLNKFALADVFGIDLPRNVSEMMKYRIKKVSNPGIRFIKSDDAIGEFNVGDTIYLPYRSEHRIVLRNATVLAILIVRGTTTNYPAITRSKYGKGEAFWVHPNIFEIYYSERSIVIEELFYGMLYASLKDKGFVSVARWPYGKVPYNVRIILEEGDKSFVKEVMRRFKKTPFSFVIFPGLLDDATLSYLKSTGKELIYGGYLGMYEPLGMWEQSEVLKLNDIPGIEYKIDGNSIIANEGKFDKIFPYMYISNLNKKPKERFVQKREAFERFMLINLNYGIAELEKRGFSVPDGFFGAYDTEYINKIKEFKPANMSFYVPESFNALPFDVYGITVLPTTLNLNSVFYYMDKNESKRYVESAIDEFSKRELPIEFVITDDTLKANMNLFLAFDIFARRKNIIPMNDSYMNKWWREREKSKISYTVSSEKVYLPDGVYIKYSLNLSAKNGINGITAKVVVPKDSKRVVSNSSMHIVYKRRWKEIYIPVEKPAYLRYFVRI